MDLNGVLACPRCEAALDGGRCAACRVEFPVLDGAPWLFADPGAAVADWRQRWQLAVARLRGEAAAAEAALAEAPGEATRRRLHTLVSGYRAQSAHLQTLLAPLLRAPAASLETLLALRTRLPPAQDVLSYEANVFRDWVWGEAENDHAREAALAALGDRRPGRILVLGAGAGRLAYDLHQSTGAALTVAMDCNPLLAWTCRRVARGEDVALVEFPLAPLDPDRAAIERTLRAPTPARAGFEVVLGDARRPPFRPGTFDVVVTPWLLDVLDAGVGAMLARLNALLADDGCWIYQGSVAFQGADPAERLTLLELIERAADAGFGDIKPHDEVTPYLASPDSRHGRREQVTTFAAAKVTGVTAPPRHLSLPEWLTRARDPVPALPAFRTQAGSTGIHAFIMSLIDGRRSIDDMARALEAQRLMPRDEAVPALRGFLIKMWEEARIAPRL